MREYYYVNYAHIINEIGWEAYRHQRVIAVTSISPRRNMFWNSKKSTIVILVRMTKTSLGF